MDERTVLDEMAYTQEGTPILPGLEPEIVPGVKGMAFDTPEGVYIPLIAAVNEGDGRVSAFLDALPRTRRIVFPNVLNPRLVAMLERRGFVHARDGGHPVMERGHE